MNASSLVQKVWNFCYTLRADIGGCGDDLEQLSEHLEAALASFRDVAAGLPRHRTRTP